jgi:7,8-dihydroneopterin aldolase/epimerase/oxygenase
MGKIIIEGMEFFAFHGHYPEEKIAGTKFIIDIKLWTNIKKAGLSDKIIDALNYQSVFECIKEYVENTKSALLENLAKGIIDKLFIEFPTLSKTEIYLKKMNPPMGGQIQSVGIVLKQSKKKRK